jgi:vitamin B12 transporter
MSVFLYNIRDMIQWHKGEYSYWVADNIKSVRSTGREASISMNYKYNNFSTRINAGYTLTKSVAGVSDTGNDESAGKQLMYVPEHQANGSLLMGFRNLYTILTANFIGKRYITEDNSKYLREYLLNNITAGIKFPFKNFSVDMNLNIDNLLNVNYQSMANYPLPGRSYLMKMLINLNK